MFTFVFFGSLFFLTALLIFFMLPASVNGKPDSKDRALASGSTNSLDRHKHRLH